MLIVALQAMATQNRRDAKGMTAVVDRLWGPCFQRWDETVFDGNTMLHLTCAAVLTDKVRAFLEDGGSKDILWQKNAQEFTPLLCARNSPAAMAPWEITNLSNANVGERIPVHKESTAWPQNHFVAAEIALKMGDIYSLFDAVEGAILSALTVPYLRADQMDRYIAKAFDRMMALLKQELDAAVKSRDPTKIEKAIELVRYSKVYFERDEEYAVELLCRVKLEQAIEKAVPSQIRAAIMALDQHHKDMTEPGPAQQARKHWNPQKVMQLKQKAQAALRDIAADHARKEVAKLLSDAESTSDLRLLQSAMHRAESERLTDLPEYKSAQAALAQLIADDLKKAVATSDVATVKRALENAKKFGQAGTDVYKWAENEMKELPVREAKKDLISGLETGNTGAILNKLKRAKQQGFDKLPEFDRLLRHYRATKGLPDQWEVNLTSGDKEMLKDMSSKKLIDHMQELLEQTWKPIWTRDRKLHGDTVLPKKLIVKQVTRVENETNYLEYMSRRAEIIDELNQPMISGYKRYEVKTHMRSGWKGVGGMVNEPIDSDLNEYYLMHGTKPEAATAIAKGDFRVDLAGSHAGTLYGRGLYFAERSSKCDEYTVEDKRGWRPILLCRVMCGNTRYIEEPFPDAGDVVDSVVSGPYHSVIGDREKCRGTFREIMVYDKNQAYPEWIVWYQRQM
jgi:hypothetical protein